MTTQGATPRPWRATIRQITGKATCFYGYVATGAKDINRCCHRQHTSAAEAHLCSAREATRRNAHDRLQAEHEKVGELIAAADMYTCGEPTPFKERLARAIKAVKEARGEA